MPCVPEPMPTPHTVAQEVKTTKGMTCKFGFSYPVPKGSDVVEGFTLNHNTLSTLQRRLRRLAAEKCLVDRLEDTCREAGPTAREQQYFKATMQVCDMPNMEGQRWCVVLCWRGLYSLIATQQVHSGDLSQPIPGQKRTE
jgi:hypothetical protein